MRIIEEVVSEDCFDTDFIKEYYLDKNLSLDFVNYLGQFGKITLLSKLKDPFFSLDKKYFFTIKGILNQNKIQVIFRRNHIKIAQEFFYELIKSYPPINQDSKEKLIDLENQLKDQIGADIY